MLLLFPHKYSFLLYQYKYTILHSSYQKSHLTNVLVNVNRSNKFYVDWPTSQL